MRLTRGPPKTNGITSDPTHVPQVVEGLGHIGMLGPERLLVDGEGPRVELCGRVVAAWLVMQRQVMQQGAMFG
jgi:hypothetical protein